MALTIPEGGLQLRSSAEAAEGLPLQAFAIDLNDAVLQDMIACIQNGENIQLSLGSIPTLLYGSEQYRIPKFNHEEIDLYLSDPIETPYIAERLANPAVSVYSHPRNLKFRTPYSVKMAAQRKAQQTTSRAHDNEDPDVARLRESTAQAQAERQNGTPIINPAVGRTKAAAGKNKLLAANGGALAQAMRSTTAPGSPYSVGASPSLGATQSASEKALVEAKQRRSHLVHVLAVKPRSFHDLRQDVSDIPEDKFKSTLDKVAEFNSEKQAYQMRKQFWKELDPFKYSYATDEDRQSAIDNAVKQLDRARVGPDDPSWQKLLPLSERGKGKCLSKLLNKPPPPPPAVRTPKITVHDAEDSTASGADVAKKRKKGGEPMSRSGSSQSTASKTGKNKPVASDKPLPTPPKPKSTPKNGAKAGSKDAKGAKVLSKEFISDSESSAEEAPLSSRAASSKAKPQPLPAEKPAKPRAVPPAAPTPPRPAANTLPSGKESMKVRSSSQATVSDKLAKSEKRLRESHDDDSSSSSGAPLSKRVVTGLGIKQPVPSRSASSNMPKTKGASVSGKMNGKDRMTSDASSGRTSQSSQHGHKLNKSKNTSPAKSSPLAYSPPTNASDMERSSSSQTQRHRHLEPTPQPGDVPQLTVSPGTTTSSNASVASSGSLEPNRKRRVSDDDDHDRRDAKKQRFPPELVSKAYKFKVFYKRYETLHNEIVAMEKPSQSRLNDLLDMRERLQKMKEEIYRDTPQANGY